MAQRLKTDWYLFITIVVMVFFGALMIFSASSVTASFKMGSSYYFVIRQIFWIVVAMGVMMALKRTHYRKLQHPAVAFVGIGIVMTRFPAPSGVAVSSWRFALAGPWMWWPSRALKSEPWQVQ